MKVKLEKLVVFGITLAVTAISTVFVQSAFAYHYDCQWYDGGTWFIRAEVEGHGSADPMLFSYAGHCGYRTALGWPITWYTDNLEVTIVGHANWRSHDYWGLYVFSGEGNVWIQGPGGLYIACDTKSFSKFRSPTAWWYKDVYASVVEGPV
jgi:hypothetical protein